MNELALTTPEFDYSAIERADLSETTRTKYSLAIQRLLDAGIDPFDGLALGNYAASLPNSPRSHLKSALAIMSREYERLLMSKADAAPVEYIQRMLWKVQAVGNAIQVHAPKGKKMGMFLSPRQIEEITALPDRSTPAGRRDWIILAVLLGAGLRRSEMANLTFSQITRQPMKDGQMRSVLNIIGKGKKKRTIPISPMLEQRLNEWKQEVGEGYVARAVNRHGTINGSLSDNAVNAIVSRYGTLAGIPELEAHDLRRTWAQVGLSNGVPITQISVLLGHSNVAVTQRYLDLEVNLENSICDFIPLSL
jgi:site-specific recombinase XerD